MEIKTISPYPSLLRLKAATKENIIGYTHNRHPYAALSQKIRQYEKSFLVFLNDFSKSPISKESAERLCKEFKDACYSVFELVEAYKKVFYCFYSKDDKKEVKRFDSTFKSLRDEISYFVNKCKHEYREIEPVVAHGKEIQVLGFFLTEPNDGNKVRLDNRFHKGGNATSFRYYITEILMLVHSLDAVIENALQKPLPEVVDDNHASFNTKQILEITSALPNIVFPNETKKVVQHVVQGDGSVFYISPCKFNLKTLKGRVRIESLYTGDGITKEFALPNI